MSHARPTHRGGKPHRTCARPTHAEASATAIARASDREDCALYEQCRDRAARLNHRCVCTFPCGQFRVKS